MSFDEPKSTDNAMHQVMHEARDYQRIEVITGRRRRRNWTDDERAQIVAESAVPGANISDVARRWGVHRGLLTVWRRETGVSAGSPDGDRAAGAASFRADHPCRAGSSAACRGAAPGRAG